MRFGNTDRPKEDGKISAADDHLGNGSDVDVVEKGSVTVFAGGEESTVAGNHRDSFEERNPFNGRRNKTSRAFDMDVHCFGFKSWPCAAETSVCASKPTIAEWKSVTMACKEPGLVAELDGLDAEDCAAGWRR